MSVEQEQDNETGREFADENAAIEPTDDGDDAALGVVSFGVERYVQMGFAALALMLFWFFSQLIQLIWNNFGEPQPIVVSVVGGALAVGVSFGLYRNEKTGALAHEIADELSKVTWPTRDELRGSTVVVIVTSIIASIYTGALDFVWSWLSDFIYSVKL